MVHLKTQLYVFSLFFARHWQYQIKYQESETEVIEGFYAYCMTIDFKPYNSSSSAESLVNQRRNEIKDRLLQAVLNEAEAPGKITNESWSISLEDESLGIFGIEVWLSKMPNS